MHTTATPVLAILRNDGWDCHDLLFVCYTGKTWGIGQELNSLCYQGVRQNPLHICPHLDPPGHRHVSNLATLTKKALESTMKHERPRTLHDQSSEAKHAYRAIVTSQQHDQIRLCSYRVGCGNITRPADGKTSNTQPIHGGNMCTVPFPDILAPSSSCYGLKSTHTKRHTSLLFHEQEVLLHC